MAKFPSVRRAILRDLYKTCPRKYFWSNNDWEMLKYLISQLVRVIHRLMQLRGPTLRNYQKEFENLICTLGERWPSTSLSENTLFNTRIDFAIRKDDEVSAPVLIDNHYFTIHWDDVTSRIAKYIVLSRQDEQLAPIKAPSFSVCHPSFQGQRYDFVTVQAEGEAQLSRPLKRKARKSRITSLRTILIGE